MSAKQKLALATRLRRIANVALFTLDIWTSIAVRSYYIICITIHYAATSGEIKNELVHFASIDPPHTGSCIRDNIERTLDFYHIDEKLLIAITADGASNNNLAIELLLNGVRRMRKLNQVKRLYCVAHLINNVVTEGLEDLSIYLSISSQLIEKVRNITFTIRNSTSLTFKQQQLKKAQKDAGMKALNVVKDVKIRWNSCFMMMERFIKLEDFMRDLMRGGGESALMEYALSGEEMMCRVREYIHILRPFKVATDYFSCSQSQNLGAVIPIYRELKQQMMTEASIADVTNPIARRLLEALEKRKDRFENEHNLLATALDPYWKSSVCLSIYRN